MAWALAYPACEGSMSALMISTLQTDATTDAGARVAVVGDCGNRTTSCTTNCQTLVSRMVSDCAALEQALTANDTTMIWWFHDRFEAIYVSARTEILSLIPADCVVEPVAAEQQPEQPHPRADEPRLLVGAGGSPCNAVVCFCNVGGLCVLQKERKNGAREGRVAEPGSPRVMPQTRGEN